MTILNVYGIMFECLVCECTVSGFVGVEQWEEPVIFAQASSSRLSENYRSSPRSFPRILA